MKNTLNHSTLNQEIIDTFEEVKNIVQKNEKRSRAGLMLGLQEIGASLDGFIGAYYPVASNIIILNKTPLRRILETNKTLLKPYIFHVLLHEYIHALGFYDEETTGQKTYEISRQQFGEHHIITQLSIYPHRRFVGGRGKFGARMKNSRGSKGFSRFLPDHSKFNNKAFNLWECPMRRSFRKGLI